MKKNKPKTMKKIAGYLARLDMMMEMNFEECLKVYEGVGNVETARVLGQGLGKHIAAGNWALKAAKMGGTQNVIQLGGPSPKQTESKE